MISLESLIGSEIVAYIPIFHKTRWQKLKLVNVEMSGIWVENKDLLEETLKGSGLTASPKTAVFFLPFSQIVHILASVDVPFLSDEALK